MRIPTIVKVLGALGLAGGGIALMTSDNKNAVKFRDNLGHFTGVMFGSAARAMQGSDISYTHDTGWKIEPHKDSPTPKPADIVKSVASPYGIDPQQWADMDYYDQQQYMELIKMQHDHEIKMKALEVEKAQAEANVVISTVEEKEEKNNG